MNQTEAKAILSEYLRGYRERPYSELAAWVSENHVETEEIVAPSGARYQVEIVFVWDTKQKANVRVIGSIDDGGIRALVPVSDDFIISPQGCFIGE